MILSLPTKHRSIRPTDHGKAMKSINSNVVYYKDCPIEVLAGGKYKVFGETYNTHHEACIAINNRFNAFNALRELV